MAKRVKSSNDSAELPDEDIISQLEDGIRCHILTFLPLRDVIATSILSTKWKNLWTTLDNIEFYDFRYPFDCRNHCGDMTDEELRLNIIKFARMINKILLLHKAPVMKRFSLICNMDSLYDVHSWVSVAINKKIERLRLCLHAVKDAPVELPTSLFNCDTLEVLELEGSILFRELTSYSLPRLKTLKLLAIDYENVDSAQKLISSCPSLESLVIDYPDDNHADKFIISSSTLRDLSFYYNGQSIQVINCPDLKHLVLEVRSPTELFIQNLSSLAKADLTFHDVWDIEAYGDISNLLLEISNVKILSISTTCESTFPAHLFPKFDILSTLIVYTKRCDWDLLYGLISNSDILETLSVILCPRYPNEEVHVVVCRSPETVPTCLLSSLRKMTIYGFKGRENELEMVEYILKNAKVLQKMEICLHYSLSKQIVIQLIQKLLKFPTGSEECQVDAVQF